MDDIINEAYQIVQCKECPWFKACVTPMRFTSEDIRRQMEQGIPGSNASQQQVNPQMQEMISSMASAAQNSLLEGCPVFIQRLRSSPQLGQQLKNLMLNFGDDKQLPKS